MSIFRVNLWLCAFFDFVLSKALLEDCLESYDVKILVIIISYIDLLILCNLEDNVTGLLIV